LTVPIGASERTVRFQVGSATAALAAADVREIVRRPRMIRVPHGPSQLVGLANLRGTATPLFSLAGLLSRADGGDGAWVIVLNRSPVLGLLVDRVESIADGAEATQGTMTVSDGNGRRAVTLTDLLDGQAVMLQARSATQFSDLPEIAAERHEGATIGLLSFTLGGQRYALPLSDIVEVASLPSRMKAGRDGSLGKATIRGRRTALVPLGKLLGVSDGTIAGNERVIVVDRGGERIGLVVDGARAILRAPESAVSAPPALLNREDDATRIHAVVRLADGRGVVSVLTVGSLFGGDAAYTATATARDGEAAAEDTHRFVIFRIGDEDYGYPIEAIAEIVRPPETLTRVPGAPDYIAGAVNLRGAVVPILDQRQRFGAAPASADRDDRVLVVDIAGVRTGLLVDGVADIRQVAAGRIGAAPELSGGAQRLFDRVITAARQEEHMILVVDPDTLLSRAELDQLAVFSGTAAETAHL